MYFLTTAHESKKLLARRNAGKNKRDLIHGKSAQQKKKKKRSMLKKASKGLRPPKRDNIWRCGKPRVKHVAALT